MTQPQIRRKILFYAICVAVLMPALACSKQGTQPERAAKPTAPSASAAASGPWRMELRVTPEHPRMIRPVTFALHVADREGLPVNAAEVNGALTMKDMDMGSTQLRFTSRGNGDYEASVKSMDMSGQWSLTVEATRGSIHSKRSFEIAVYD